MAMLDLALIEDPVGAVDRAADPVQFVVAVCERAKTWLQLAKEHDDTAEALEKVKETRQFAATLRTATMQKELGKDCELAALEICRRAERLMAELIRLGQEAAEIAREGQNGGRPWPSVTESAQDSVTRKPRSLDYFGSTTERRDANVMAEIPDEQFEQLLAEAKAEKDLSRSNIVRKVGREPASRTPAGRKAAREKAGATTPSEPRNEWHRKRHRIDSNRIVREAIFAADGAVQTLDLIDWDGVTPEDWWVDSLTNSIRMFRTLLAKLKEIEA